MLYRVIRSDENWQDGLWAKNPNSYESVFNHVNYGSSKGWQSPYISTCGSLNSVLNFRRNRNPHAQIVQIWEENLPVVKIDLRTSSKRSNHYIRGIDKSNLIYRFNKFSSVCEEVLIVGYVPGRHVELMDNSDFHWEQLHG